MRRRIVVAALLVLGGCGQQQQGSREDLRTFDVSEGRSEQPMAVPLPPAPPPTVSTASADGAGPSINVTAAPGVAFNYRYAYRLPNTRIEAAQEAHAQMCEKLTVARCRITGMRYTLTGERSIDARLDLKLDPAIARQFGKEATKVVTDAKGMLVNQEISGTDTAPTIANANRGRAQLQDELNRINRELARPGLGNAVRDRLLSEAQGVRQQMQALTQQRQDAEDSLATTPMTFNYGSGRTVPGFDEDRPIAKAFEAAGDSLLAAVSFLIIAVATLLPWVLLALLAVWLWRRLGIGRWLARRSDESYAASEAG